MTTKAAWPPEVDRVARLVERVQLPSARQQKWVAIAGGPGSGKTTLASCVKQRLEAEGLRVCVVPMDGYHFYRRELDAMPDPAHAHAKRGAPFTFNAPRLLEDLAVARRRGEGLFPSFDHARGDPVEGDVELRSDADVVLVEGLYLMLREAPWNRLLELFDVGVFVRCAEPEQRRRIIARHMAAGRTGAADRADNNDLPNGRFVNENSQVEAAGVEIVESTPRWQSQSGGSASAGAGGGSGGGGDAATLLCSRHAARTTALIALAACFARRW